MTSKYLNGHSDVIGGCLVRRERLSAMHGTIHKHLGGTVNALDAWLVLGGLRTFALRMDTHSRNGQAVAERLLRRREVARVHYPGLALYSQTELFQRQRKHGGALLACELSGGEEAACRFLDRLGFILHAVSLGGLDNLVVVAYGNEDEMIKESFSRSNHYERNDAKGTFHTEWKKE